MSTTIELTESWLLSGRLLARLASRRDGERRYVTASVGKMAGRGLLPRDHRLRPGDALASLVHGQFVVWILNRRNGRTVAAWIPEGLPIPTIGESGLTAMEYSVVIIAPMRGAVTVSSEGRRLELTDEVEVIGADEEI